MVPPTRLTKMSVRFWSLAVTKWGTNQLQYACSSSCSASNYESLHEELQAYCKATNENLKKNPIISNGVKSVSLNVANDEDCLIYTYQLLNADKTKTTPESLQSAADNLRPILLQEIKNQSNNAEYVRRCMDFNYSFKYYYYDKDGNFLISITLKPEDYQ